ncbi:MAG: type II secretion system F family protein [Candidatus Pacebacteria bacterium]|nr:type II secretion system F family protein [Candidatus Paceibacterota bacterium]
MKFKYQAKTKDGEMQVGFVEATNRDMAVSILTTHGLFVMSVVEESEPGLLDRVSQFFARAKQKDLVIFARQLATLLEARLPLGDALKILRQQTENVTLREAIYQISQDIDAGLSFSQALARQGHTFPDYYTEMVRAAEVTGNMNEVAVFLADYTEKEGDLASKVSSALIYPAIVLLLFVAVAFVLLAFVFPSLGDVFAQNGVTLPWYTQVLLDTGNFLQKWWPAVLVAGVVLSVLGINYAETDEGIALIDEAKIRVPIAKKVFIPVVLARFGNSAALLVHGGIPIAQSLEILSHMLGNTLYRDITHQIADDVRQGSLLSESIAKYPGYFPPLVSQMLAVGETTGKIEEMFGRVATIYTRESDEVTNNLVDLIQPIMMIGMGLMVGLLFASVLIPIYNLTANIH